MMLKNVMHHLLTLAFPKVIKIGVVPGTLQERF